MDVERRQVGDERPARIDLLPKPRRRVLDLIAKIDRFVRGALPPHPRLDVVRPPRRGDHLVACPARGLSYDTVQRILAAMSDQGGVNGQGQPRAAASAAKVRCRVLAFTGLRPSELMRYRPEHWDRTTHTLVVLTGKGGRTGTIPLSAPAAEALADLEALGALGPFSMSTVRRAVGTCGFGALSSLAALTLMLSLERRGYEAALRN